MDQKKNRTISQLSTYKRKISKRFTIHQMYLYGSRARGDHLKTSDVDVLIISSTFLGIPFTERMYLVTKEWKNKLELEAFCYTPEEFNQKKNESTYMKQILKEAIPI